MSIQAYAVVTPGGNVVNIVNWDGVTPYNAAPNSLVLATGQPNAQIGGTYIGGVFTAPATPPAPQGIIFLNSPASGAVLALPNAPQPQARLYCILEPAATLAALTLDLGTAPIDGDQLYIFSTHIVTALTLVAPSGTAVNNPPTSLAALVYAYIIYSAQFNAWFQL
jgi:hypothetical protein